MDAALKQGLEPASFNGGQTSEDQVGTQKETVTTAVGNLETCVENLNTFIGTLTQHGEEILNGWTGEAASAFRVQFPVLVDEFKKVPTSVQSIADWAKTTKTNYADNDDATAQAIRQATGGAQ